jgi:rhodanese-related sulfurtransferase
MLFRRGKSLTPKEAAAAFVRGELQLIEVREPAELAETRIDGAVHIPLGQLNERLRELDTDQRLAFLCRSGARSAMATRTAANAGLDASNVKGGVVARAQAGLPLTTTPHRGAA